jgi:hypothetical protein
MVKKKSKLDDMFEPKDNNIKAVPKKKSRKVEIYQSRKVDNYHGSKVDIGKRGRRQVSFWLPVDLVEAFQIQAVKEKKNNSQMLAEFIRMGLHQAEEKK